MKYLENRVEFAKAFFVKSAPSSSARDTKNRRPYYRSPLGCRRTNKENLSWMETDILQFFFGRGTPRFPIPLFQSVAKQDPLPAEWAPLQPRHAHLAAHQVAALLVARRRAAVQTHHARLARRLELTRGLTDF